MISVRKKLKLLIPSHTVNPSRLGHEREIRSLLLALLRLLTQLNLIPLIKVSLMAMMLRLVERDQPKDQAMM